MPRPVLCVAFSLACSLPRGWAVLFLVQMESWECEMMDCEPPVQIRVWIDSLWIWFSCIAYSYPPLNMLSAFTWITPNGSRWLRLKNEAEGKKVEGRFIRGMKYTCVIILCRRSAFYYASQILCVSWLRVCGNPASSKSAGTIFQQYLLPSWLCVTFC